VLAVLEVLESVGWPSADVCEASAASVAGVWSFAPAFEVVTPVVSALSEVGVLDAVFGELGVSALSDACCGAA
jgi:hypothetical protein